MPPSPLINDVSRLLSDFHYLASIAVKEGKVFALFVRSPTRMFKSNEAGLRHILETFRLL